MLNSGSFTRLQSLLSYPHQREAQMADSALIFEKVVLKEETLYRMGRFQKVGLKFTEVLSF